MPGGQGTWALVPHGSWSQPGEIGGGGGFSLWRDAPRPSLQLQGILDTLCSMRQLPLKLCSEDLRLVGETPSARALGGGCEGAEDCDTYRTKRGCVKPEQGE